MAFLAVWLEHGLKREAIDRAFDRDRAARGQLRTGGLWQSEKRPGAVVRGCRPEEFRFETDLGSGLRHLLDITN